MILSDLLDILPNELDLEVKQGIGNTTCSVVDGIRKCGWIVNEEVISAYPQISKGIDTIGMVVLLKEKGKRKL